MKDSWREVDYIWLRTLTFIMSFSPTPLPPVLMNKLKMCRAGLEICEYVADRFISSLFGSNHFIGGLQGMKGWRAGRPVRSHVLGQAEISPASQLQKAKCLSLNFKVFLQMLSKAPSHCTWTSKELEKTGSFTKVKIKANGKMFLPDR